MPLKIRIRPSALVVPFRSPPVVLTCAAAAALMLIVITRANVAVRNGCLVIVFLGSKCSKLGHAIAPTIAHEPKAGV